MSQMNHLGPFLNVMIQILKSGFLMKISGLPKKINIILTSCQSESEFVNHLLAASKSVNDWIRSA